MHTLVGMFPSLQVSRIHPARSMRIISVLVPLLLLLLLLPPGAADLRARSFQRYSRRLNWETARATCRLNHDDLVTVTNTSQNFSQYQGWIGLYRENSTSEWRWSRGDRKADFTLWRAGNQRECLIVISVNHVPVVKTVTQIKIKLHQECVQFQNRFLVQPVQNTYTTHNLTHLQWSLWEHFRTVSENMMSL